MGGHDRRPQLGMCCEDHSQIAIDKLAYVCIAQCVRSRCYRQPRGGEGCVVRDRIVGHLEGRYAVWCRELVSSDHIRKEQPNRALMRSIPERTLCSREGLIQGRDGTKVATILLK